VKCALHSGNIIEEHIDLEISRLLPQPRMIQDDRAYHPSCPDYHPNDSNDGPNMHKHAGKLRKHPPGAAGGRALFSQLYLMSLYIWAIILVIATMIWATRIISPIILNHPRMRRKPANI
jgi:hypothetical protein